MLTKLFWAGLTAVQDYVATHVLTCLVPAFLLAGAMITFIDRDTILDHLGARANKLRSFPLAAGGSFFVAACSCTVIPVASGLYYAGAGVGAAFIMLWVAPSSNLLSLVYTGNVLGGGMVLSRVIAALIMAFVVGTVMSLVFKDKQSEPASAPGSVQKRQVISRQDIILLVLLALSLLLPNYLMAERPYAYKVLTWAVCTLIVAVYTWKTVPVNNIKIWAGETWWFVKTIFPLLICGVFLVGVIGSLLPEEWIRQWLGGNGVVASFLATMVGSVTYFATMTEAPFVDTLMKLGMGKGPALALLLTGPGISLPNWLAIGKVFGWKKALVYVPLIMASGTMMGWFFGNFVF